MSFITDARIDRLYQLLPALHRIRDAEQGFPLQALLRIVAEQANVVEDNITQLYENWFLETAEDWAVPYIADLVGYQPVLDPGEAATVTDGEGRDLLRALIPRREVANTIGYRRRKGTLALLELLAKDIAGWPARAVQFYELLGWNQNLNHLHKERARTVDLRQIDSLNLLDGPFDRIAHSVDIRRINSGRTPGRYNIPSVGVFVWRLKSYSVTQGLAHHPDHAPAHCRTFSALGQDAQLFIKPEPESNPTHIAEELNLPAPIRRHAFSKHPGLYYGPGKSIVIWAIDWADSDPNQPVPIKKIKPANLSDWQYIPPRDYIAVDPVLGRLAFHPDQLPKRVYVSYQYALSGDIGGGEYTRILSEPASHHVSALHRQNSSKSDRQSLEAVIIYRVGKDHALRSLGPALHQWGEQKPWDAVIELTDSSTYVVESYDDIVLDEGRTLQIRAANGARPIIRLSSHNDDETDDNNQDSTPELHTITISEGSRFTIDGLLITGCPIYFRGAEREKNKPLNKPIPGYTSEILIRHCTLVPAGTSDRNGTPISSTEPSLVLHQVHARVRVEHSISGPIQIHEDEVQTDPLPVYITDSILDATHPKQEALGAPGSAVAHVILTMLRSTVFGIVSVHAVELAENSIFNDCVNVARRQVGCLRFCYVPLGCRTPRRYRCQPDLGKQAVQKTVKTDLSYKPIELELQRLTPRFTSKRYGDPGYAQLAMSCAEEIQRGAEDESEMGAFHDIFQPQRTSNLQARLQEYTPAGMNVGIVFVN